MTSPAELKQIYFLENILPKLIVSRNVDLQGSKVVKCVANSSKTLDGFMSAMYQVELVLQNNKNIETQLQLIVKLMVAQDEFREATYSDVQFSNEIYIYKEVLPVFEEMLLAVQSKKSTLKWCPRAFYAEFGVFEDLGPVKESILALENLKPANYRSGPRLDLDEKHLMLMIEIIAEYHALSYALKIQDPVKFKTLTNGLKPFKFVQDTKSSQDVIYQIALDRIFEFSLSTPLYLEDEKLIQDINKIKNKFGAHPTQLMEDFLKNDEPFSVILHGDYNRNNVLFQYDMEEGFENPMKVKMFDFQQVRYASPALDLSFFMYMNMTTSLRNEIWDKLLQFYHKTLITSLAEYLECQHDDLRLKPYEYQKFLQHFSQFAFYGGMIASHFLPVMMCEAEVCAKISEEFTKDVFSDCLRNTIYYAGGLDAKERIMEVVKHASTNGYLEFLN